MAIAWHFVAHSLLQGLEAEIKSRQAGLFAYLNQALPVMPSKAHRWIAEMEEIADTFQSLGLAEHILHGVAEMYHLVKDTSLDQETPENRDRDRPLSQVIFILSEEGHP